MINIGSEGPSSHLSEGASPDVDSPLSRQDQELPAEEAATVVPLDPVVTQDAAPEVTTTGTVGEFVGKGNIYVNQLINVINHLMQFGLPDDSLKIDFSNFFIWNLRDAIRRLDESEYRIAGPHYGRGAAKLAGTCLRKMKLWQKAMYERMDDDTMASIIKGMLDICNQETLAG